MIYLIIICSFLIGIGVSTTIFKYIYSKYTTVRFFKEQANVLKYMFIIKIMFGHIENKTNGMIKMEQDIQNFFESMNDKEGIKEIESIVRVNIFKETT